MARTQASKRIRTRTRKKSNKKRRSWISRKPRGVTDAQALAAEKKITKHIPNAKSIGDVLVGIAQTQEWIENVEDTLALRTEQDTDRKRTEADERQSYHELRIAEASRKHTSTQAKKGLADASRQPNASRQPKLTIA